MGVQVGENPPVFFIIKAKRGEGLPAEIITSIIACAGTVIGSFFGVLASSRLTTYRIKQLEEKVDKHNQVIDRVYKLEARDAVHDEEIKVANHRISDLEDYHK